MKINVAMKLMLRIQDENSLLMSVLDKTFDEKSLGDIIDDSIIDITEENKQNDSIQNPVSMLG